MKWRVLVSAPPIFPVINDYRSIFEKNKIEVVIPPDPVEECLREEKLIPLISDIDGAICGDDQFTESVLRAAKNLKVISKWGTGIDSIDTKAAEKLGILVYRTKGAFADPVSDTVMGYILTFARNLIQKDRLVRDSHWRKIPSVTLKECTLGVIGVGNIGKAIVRRAIGFGMRILGNDTIQLPEDFISETGLKPVSLANILSMADFVTLNCDLNPTSYHLIGRQELELMKPTAYLINTSRGQIIDEAALVETLQARKIAGAALDVFVVEPLPLDSPLRQLDNCLLSPHNSNASPSVFRSVHEKTIQNLLYGLNKKTRV